MCGIVGFTGSRPALEFICKGLKKLEYRGYDSAGLAVCEKNEIKVIKTCNRVDSLNKEVAESGLTAKCSIGHTRWATHGAPEKRNAHPHLSEDGKFAVVHNGIIENYTALKTELEAEGFTFKSETDTEVVPMLLQKYYKGDLKEAVFETSQRLEGSFALLILCTDFSDTLSAVKNFSPLIIGMGKGENYVASDVTAIPSDATNGIALEDGQVAFIKPDNISVYDSNRSSVSPNLISVQDFEQNDGREEYRHYMMKEIKEQPEALRDTISCYIRNGMPVFHHIDTENLKNIREIEIIACGSAYYAGEAARYYIETLLGLPCRTHIASEYRYKRCLADENTLSVAISQSGETADTIAAITKAKESGAKTVSIVNVKNSSITRITDYNLYTIAGPEIAVATTKAYSTQLALLYILGLWIGEVTERLSEEEVKEMCREIERLPEITVKTFESEKTIKKTAKLLVDAESVFFIGRNIDYAVALEGSLKLKEISYIHSESYPAGELKHGTLSLIEKGTPVIALCSQGELKAKTESNIKEAAARGGMIIKLSPDIQSENEREIKLPQVHPLLMASAEVIPLQLLAYYTALYKGCDIDKPRNLAKSVTVE